MIKILLFIKHRLGFLWKLIETLNGFLFGIFFSNQINRSLMILLSKSHQSKYTYKKLETADLPQLHNFFMNQDPEQFLFFKPHAFDLVTLKRLHRNQAFRMMGVFDGGKLIGYFFLRFFLNRKCFIGRIVDGSYQRQGIARGMNDILYPTAWQNGFHCLTTISENNHSIFNLHQKEENMVVLKELANDYLLVEIRKPEQGGVI